MAATSEDLDRTSLSAEERRVLVRFVALVRRELGSDLHGIWLYGSRARGELRRSESDVDLLVVVRGERLDTLSRVTDLVFSASRAEGAPPDSFAALTYAPERVDERRAIRSFFMQEVDRDKIVLWGTG